MNGRLVKDGLGWGFALWLFGYALSMMLFAFGAPGTFRFSQYANPPTTCRLVG